MRVPEYLRVLYAEDDDDTSYMVTVLLKFSDIEVTTAETVTKAWRIAQVEDFDLYLLDSRFPDGSGLELCRHLRRHAPHKPILFYSGDVFETDVEKGLAAGADAYLPKPYLDDLAVTIEQTIKRNNQALAG